MGNQWVLKTNGNPLATIRKFLGEVWLQLKLDGLLIPAYDHQLLKTHPLLLENPTLLENVDPFLPLTVVELARFALLLSQEKPEAHFGIILRSCESRTFNVITRRAWVPLESGSLTGWGTPESNWFTISVDCLSSYPVEDFTWWFEKSGTTEHLSRENLNFAHQGGIAPYRYRPACQMCVLPAAQEADLMIGVLGLPVFEEILIFSRDESTSNRLDLSRLTNGLASPEQISRHTQMILTLNDRHTRFWERAVSELSNEMPGDVDEFIHLITTCAPCRACLEACPIYNDEMQFDELSLSNVGKPQLQNIDQYKNICHWLAACISCGMCEDVCPKYKPLTAVISRIRKELIKISNEEIVENNESLGYSPSL